jgi:hypothetical protein
MDPQGRDEREAKEHKVLENKIGRQEEEWR